MANREKGEVDFTVGGTTYTLRLTVDATAQLEDLCSTPERDMFFPEILRKVSNGSVKYTRLFIWMCLREHHPKMDVHAAGALIDGAGGPIAFAEKVMEVMQSTHPDPEDVPARPQTAQAIARGAGGRSTSRRAK